MPAKKTVKPVKPEVEEEKEVKSPEPKAPSPQEARRAAGWPSSKDLGTWHKGHRTAR